MKLYPVAGKEMQDQSRQWLAVRRDRPNWMIMWGWGAMNPTAVKRAAENGYPMDHFIGVWWSGSDDDARGGGKAAKGYLALNFNGLGANYPAIQDIKKYVVDKGKSQVEKDKFADTFYNRGVFNSVLIAEAIRNAQKITGKKVVDGAGRAPRPGDAQHHRGALEETRLSELRHAGARHLRRPQRPQRRSICSNGTASSGTGSPTWIEPMKDKVEPLLQAAAADYVKKNTGWPKRTEACAKLP